MIITFLNEEKEEVISEETNGAKSLGDLIEECEIDTGVSDLAEQHDHYHYGKEKK